MDATVGLEPLHRSARQLLPVLAGWAVLAAGRRVCLVAQRLPPVVRLVRWVDRTWQR